MTSIALIGCGHMGNALVRGWISIPDHSFKIKVIKPTPDFHDPVVANAVDWHSEGVFLDSHTGPVILAVKPAQMRRAISDIKPYLKKGQSIITMAAGLTLVQYKKSLPDNPVTRIMPSLPAANRQSMTPVYGDEPELAQALFDPLGGTVIVDSDRAMDVATVILGCGPGYMAFYLESLQDSALALGLDDKAAHCFVKAMSKASLSWLDTQNDYEQAVLSVGREGSMTAAAIRSLREQKIPDSIKAALTAALNQAELISKNY